MVSAFAVAMLVSASCPVADPSDGLSIQALLDLPAPEFRAAFEGFTLPEVASSADLEPLFGRCRLEVNDAAALEREEENHYPLVFACARVLERLAEASSDPAPLLDMFDELRTEGSFATALLTGLLKARIAKDVSGPERTENKVLALPPARAPLPQRLQNAPTALKAAWETRQRLMEASPEDPADPASEAIPIHEHWDEFHVAIVDLLRGRLSPGDAVRQLQRLEWGGTCGMGSEALYEPRALALTVAHLASGRWPEAAAEYFSGLGGDGDERSYPTLSRLLQRAGVDVEQALMGLVLDGHGDAAGQLARYGNERTANLLLSAADLPADDNRAEILGDERWFLETLAAFVQPGGTCTAEAEGLASIVRDPAVGFAPAADELGILDRLHRRVAAGASLSEAETGTSLLLQTCRDESIPTFTKMLRSPYQRVREGAAAALRSKGRKVAPPSPTPPVRFRVLVDGKTLPNVEMAFTIEGSNDAWQTSGHAATDGGGLLALPGDSFLDPKNVAARVRLRIDQASSASRLLVDAVAARPDRLDRLVDVSVATQALTVACSSAGDEPMRIMLVSAPERGQEEADVPGFRLTKMFESASLPLSLRIPPGPYRLMFHRQGLFWSGEFTVGSEPTVVNCGDFQEIEHGAPIVP